MHYGKSCFNPSEKYENQLGSFFPIYGKQTKFMFQTIDQITMVHLRYRPKNLILAGWYILPLAEKKALSLGKEEEVSWKVGRTAYIYMYIYIYIFAYIYIHMYIYMHIYIHMYIYICKYLYIHMYIYIYMQIYIYIHIYIYISLSLYLSIYLYIYI